MVSLSLGKGGNPSLEGTRDSVADGATDPVGAAGPAAARVGVPTTASREGDDGARAGAMGAVAGPGECPDSAGFRRMGWWDGERSATAA